MSSFDQKYMQKLEAAKQFFGEKEIVSRQELLEFQDKCNIQLPAKFWANNRVARGMFSLVTAVKDIGQPIQKSKDFFTVSIDHTGEEDTNAISNNITLVHIKDDEYTASGTKADLIAYLTEHHDGSEEDVRAIYPELYTQQHQKAEVVSIHKKNDSDVITKFSYDEMIPEMKETFVEWGNFKTLETLLKTNQFFTLYITGDSGSGKNEMIAQACAKLKKPMVRVSITRETKEEHLIGSKTLVDGTIMYEEGPIKWAAENGAVLILDELSLAEPNEIMCLQSVMEGNSFFIKAANKLVKPVPGFCIIATDNTKGRGSDSGRYIGTNILNDAFLERFEMTMEQGYPSEKIEKIIIDKMMQKIGMDDPQFANKLIQWVHSIRKVYIEEGLEEQITTRRACHIVNTYAKLKNAEKAIELCVNRFDETTKLAMISLWEKLVPTAE